MKKYCIYFLIFISISIFAKTEDKIFNTIRSKYKIIETEIKKNNFIKKKVEYTAYEQNQYGSVTLYNLKNIKNFSKIYLKTILNDENLYEINFYLNNNKLFFAYAVSSVPSFSDGKQTNYIIEERYYFRKQKLIKHLEKKYQVSIKSLKIKNKEVKINRDDEKEILEKLAAAQAIFKNSKTDKRALY